MRIAHLITCFLFTAWPCLADTVIAARNIRPGSILLPSDLTIRTGDIAGSYGAVEALIGLEARVALYAGRPILSDHVGPPATVERNQIVQLFYETNGLTILAEGRALGRGAEGHRIRVMNLASKSSLFGTIQPDGRVRVSQ